MQQLQYSKAGQVHLVHIRARITRLHKPIRVLTTHWMRTGSQLKTRDEGERAGQKEKAVVIDVMEVSCQFNNLASTIYQSSYKIKCNHPLTVAYHDISDFLFSFPSQTKRRKPHEAHSAN